MYLPFHLAFPFTSIFPNLFLPFTKQFCSKFSYFEFLITSEFKLENNVPRVCLWTTNVVRSYIALDSTSSKHEFGRLDMINKYIEDKLPPGYKVEDKLNMQVLSQNFVQKVVENSFPTVKAYIDDIFPAVCSNQRAPKQIRTAIAEPSNAVVLHKKPEPSNEVVLHKKPDGLQNKGNVNETMLLNFSDKFFIQLLVPCINDDNLLSTSKILIDITKKLGTRFHIYDEEPFSLSQPSVSVEHLLCPRPMMLPSGLDAKQIEYYEDIRNSKITKETEKFLFQKEANSVEVSANKLLKQKFSWSTVRFYNESGYEEVPRDRNLSLTFENNQTEPPTAIQREKLHTDHRWGLSLNERVLGEKSTVHNIDRFGPEPSFNAIDEAILESGISPQSVGLILSNNKAKASFKPSVFSPKEHVVNNSSPLRNISFLSPSGATQKSFTLPSAHQKCHKSPNATESSTKSGHSTLFEKGRNAGQKANSGSSQAVFSTAFEHEFYNLIKSFAGKLETSPRIFQVGARWVDQRTLTLSIIDGGWTHKRVMDCFTELFLFDQYMRVQSGEFLHNEVLKYIVDSEFLKLLMDPLLNHFEHKECFREKNVGFRLENAGLVHIPCVVPTQQPQAVWVDSGIFVLRFMITFNGIEVELFSQDDIQSLREKYLSMLVLSRHNTIKLPFIWKFLSSFPSHVMT